MRDLVVSFYNEDIGWLPEVNNHRIFLYDKSGNILLPKDVHKHVRLPNIGRESHTYLCHIVGNYDNLAEWTIFTQGWPFDHCHYFLELLECPTVESMTKIVKRNEWKVLEKEGFLGLTGFSHFPKHTPVWSWSKFPIALSAFHEYCGWPSEFFDDYPFNGGAIIAVHKNAIRSRNIAFYKGLIDLHKKQIALPWVLETVWAILFSSPKLLL